MSEDRPSRVAIAVYAVIGVVAAAGFGTKLYQFVGSALEGRTSFAIEPVSVYIMVASGFTCLFVWATLRGQFQDIEAPKRRMLEREAELDALEEQGRKRA